MFSGLNLKVSRSYAVITMYLRGFTQTINQFLLMREFFVSNQQET